MNMYEDLATSARVSHHARFHGYPYLVDRTGSLNVGIQKSFDEGRVYFGDLLITGEYHQDKRLGGNRYIVTNPGLAADGGSVIGGWTGFTLSAVFDHNVRITAFGAMPDKSANAANEIRAAYDYSQRERSLYIDSGEYLFDGPAIQLVPGWADVVGEKKEHARIEIVGDNYLFEAPDGLARTTRFENLSTVGGKGLLNVNSTAGNAQVYAARTFQSLFIKDFTESGIQVNTNDSPLYFVRDCSFQGTDTAVTSLALGRLPNGSEVSGCDFVDSKIGLKCRGSDDLNVMGNAFYSEAGRPLGPKISIWSIPGDNQRESRLSIVHNKFGNENLTAGDYRIVYANELPGSADNGTALPDLVTESTGFVEGIHVVDNTIAYSTDIEPPLVYSTTKRLVQSCNIHSNNWTGAATSIANKSVIEFAPSTGLPPENDEFVSMKCKDGSGFRRINPYGVSYPVPDITVTTDYTPSP